MSTPSVVIAVGGHRRDCKITVASLCCDSGEAESASTELNEQRHLHRSETRSSPDVVPIWAQYHHHPEGLNATVDRPCSLVSHSSGFHDSGLATQFSQVSRSDTNNSSAKIPYHLDNHEGVAVPLPPMPSCSKAVYRHRGAEPRVPTSTQSPCQ
jgi:hypothetical protein